MRAPSCGLLVLLLALVAPARSVFHGPWPSPVSGSADLYAAISQAPPEDEAPRPADRDSVRILRDAQRWVRIETSYMYRAPLDRAIARLDAFAEQLPGSNWIAGHRVGLRIKAGDLDGALAVARSCQAEEWWCSALTAFVLHALGDFRGAEAAFDAAYETMPEDEKCVLASDVNVLLVGGIFSGGVAGKFRGADCDERLEMEPRIWWLSDPLYLVPGNDRRTEHLARALAMRLYHEWLDLRTMDTGFIRFHVDEFTFDSMRVFRFDPWDRAWIENHYRPVIRAGLDLKWWSENYAGRPFTIPSPPFYDTVPMAPILTYAGYGFVPRGDEYEDYLQTKVDDWRLEWTSLERYDPPYGPIYDVLDQQVGFFRRGVQYRVAAAIDLAPDHPLADVGEMEAGVVLSRGEWDEPTIVRAHGDGPVFRFRTDIPAERHFVSVEVVSDSGAARARFGHGLPDRSRGGFALSDVLLFEWADDATADLEGIAQRMLGKTRVPRDGHTGAFWEVYDAGDADEVAVSLRISQPRSLFGRLAATLGLGRRDEVSISWREPVGADESEMFGRTLGVDLATLPPGLYLLEIRVSTPDGRRAEARREIEIVG